MGTKEDSVGDDGTQLSRPLFLKSSTTLYSRRKVQIKEPSDGGFFNAGLGAAGATSAAETLIKSVHPTKQEEPTFQSSQEKQKKIGFFAMFHYSTYHERALMVVGIIMASISGLSMPIWLMLLGESLEMFNQIGQIIASGGSITILLDQMYALIYSFAIVGAVALVTGTTYVAMWTYVGEMQALRIRQAFVKSALRQEAAWFDTHGTGDPQELPILATNALTHIQTALGRSIGDTFANLLSALGCLMVALALDASLALFMLCILPVIAIAVGIISCFMRKSSGRALTEFSKCGAFASEILTGIKTIASLRAEKWAVHRYSGHAMSAQKFSIRAQIYSKLAAGVMGSLFYVTYTFAFIFGTYQVLTVFFEKSL